VSSGASHSKSIDLEEGFCPVGFILGGLEGAANKKLCV